MGHGIGEGGGGGNLPPQGTYCALRASDYLTLERGPHSFELRTQTQPILKATPLVLLFPPLLCNR